jgi:hypothetical protein
MVAVDVLPLANTSAPPRIRVESRFGSGTVLEFLEECGRLGLGVDRVLEREASPAAEKSSRLHVRDPRARSSTMPSTQARAGAVIVR